MRPGSRGRSRTLLKDGLRFLARTADVSSASRLIAKNTLWLGLGQGVSGLVMFFVTIYLARRFGAGGYGQFAFALSYVSLFAMLFDFGLPIAVTRELVRDAGRIREFPAVLTLKGAIGIAAILTITVSTLFFVHTHQVRMLVAILALYSFFLELLNLFYAVFRSRQRMELETRIRLLQTGALGVLVFAVGSHWHSLRAIAYAFVASPLVAFAVLATRRWARNHRDASVRLVDLTVWKVFLAIGVYLALARGVADIITNTDSVILGAWGFIRDVGRYNAAGNVNGLLLFPMVLISTAIFPALVARLRDSPDGFVKYWLTWMRLSTFVAGLVAAGTLICARAAVVLAFGASFGPAAPALEILVFTTSLTYIHNLYFQAFLALDLQAKIFRTLVVAAIGNVALNIALVPILRLYGSALASVVAHAAILGQYVLIGSRVPLLRPLARPLSASLGTSLVSAIASVVVARSLNVSSGLFLGAAVVSVVYTAVWIALRPVTNRFSMPASM